MFMTPQACLEAGTEYPRYKLFVGFDVGKRFHAAHARTGSGRRVLALRVDNDEAAVDAFVARALEAAGCEPGACLVVVDQRRNIGTVVVRRALAAGCDVAYITGKREKKARELFPGVAKNDAKDAEVIAAAAAGMPQSLLPVPREDDGLEGARRLRSQLAFSVKQSTQVKSRIRAALVESNGHRLDDRPQRRYPAAWIRPAPADGRLQDLNGRDRPRGGCPGHERRRLHL